MQHVVHRDGGARVGGVGAAVDGGGARGVGVLPDAERVVDEQVVQEEDGVAGRGLHLRHDGADAVVAVGVRSASLSVTCIGRKGGKGK